MFPRCETSKTVIWFFFLFGFFLLAAIWTFSHPLLKRAPWQNFSLLEWCEEYKVLVLCYVLPVCMYVCMYARSQKSAIWELWDWVTDSWWLFIKLLKICLSPKHFCVYVCVLTSLVGHALTMINQHQCLKLKPCPPLPHQISTHLPSTKSSSDQRQPRSRLLYMRWGGGGCCMALWHMTRASALIRFL